MTAASNADIRSALRRRSSGPPEWLSGDRWMVTIDTGDRRDIREDLSLRAARSKLAEIIERHWPDAPCYRDIIDELRDGDDDLFVDGRTYALTADESALGEIQRAD